MKRAVTAIILGLYALIGEAQSDTLPAFRVQIPLDTLIFDSLWLDTTWAWSGPCPTERISVRLVDETTRQVAMRHLPCAPVATDQAEWAATSTAYVSPTPTDFAIHLNLSRTSVAAWNWGAPEACFPPTSQREVEAASATWDALIFEREQVLAMLEWAQDKCLSPAAVRSCVERLESEARRLELLKSLVPRCSSPKAIDLTGLFILRSTRTEAEQLVGK